MSRTAALSTRCPSTTCSGVCRRPSTLNLVACTITLICNVAAGCSFASFGRRKVSACTARVICSGVFMALAGPLNYNRLRSYSAAGLHPCQCEEILHHRQNHRAKHDGQRAAARHPGAGARVLRATSRATHQHHVRHHFPADFIPTLSNILCQLSCPCW